MNDSNETFEDGDMEGGRPGTPSLLLNYSLANTILVGLGLLIVIFVTAFGNFLVGLSLFRYRSLRTISNYLIGNLAVSDFLLSITILPLSTVNECLGHWVFGQVACNLWLISDVLYCTASIWNICIIAFDRFTATFYPMWYRDKRSAKQAALYVLTVWVIATAISVPPLLGWNDLTQNYAYNNETGVSYCTIFQTPSYVLYSASGSFFVPFFITVALYIRIFGVLRQRMRRSRTVRSSRRKALAENSNVGGTCEMSGIGGGGGEGGGVGEREEKSKNGKCGGSLKLYPQEKTPLFLKTAGNISDTSSVCESPAVIICKNDEPLCEDEEDGGEGMGEEAGIKDSRKGAHHLRVTICGNGGEGVGGGCRTVTELVEGSEDNRSISSPRPSPECGDASRLLQSDNHVISLKKSGRSGEGLDLPDELLIVREDYTPIVGAVTSNGGTYDVTVMATYVVKSSDSRDVITSSYSRQCSAPSQAGEEGGRVHQIPPSPSESSRLAPHDAREKLSRKTSVVNVFKNMGSIRSIRESWTSHQQSFEQMEMKATIRMAFIIMSFCGMWLGFFTLYVINGWCGVCSVPRELDSFFIWLGYLNSTVNPVLYAIFNEEFRRAFKKILGFDKPPKGSRGNSACSRAGSGGGSRGSRGGRSGRGGGNGAGVGRNSSKQRR